MHAVVDIYSVTLLQLVDTTPLRVKGPTYGSNFEVLPLSQAGQLDLATVCVP